MTSRPAEPPLLVRAIERASEAGGVAAALLLAALAALMLAELFARNVLGASLHLTWELGTYAMGGTFFLGAASALRHAEHVRVGIALELLGERASRVLELLVTALALGVVAYLLYSVGALAWRSYSGDVRSWSGYRVPLVLPQLVLLVGIALLWLQLLARLIRLGLGLPPDALHGTRIADADGDGPVAPDESVPTQAHR